MLLERYRVDEADTLMISLPLALSLYISGHEWHHNEVSVFFRLFDSSDIRYKNNTD